MFLQTTWALAAMTLAGGCAASHDTSHLDAEVAGRADAVSMDAAVRPDTEARDSNIADSRRDDAHTPLDAADARLPTLGLCCPLGTPSCHCGVPFGGWAPTLETCGIAPCGTSPSSWTLVTDVRGCPMYLTGSGSMRPCPDAGPGTDAAPDGPTGVCCPLGYPSCNCGQPVGGWAPSLAECMRGPCDAHPADWHLTTDAHGCPVYDIGWTTSCF